ncbi:hypothetical protein AAAV41_05440, partial [Hominiventricola filiformis]
PTSQIPINRTPTSQIPINRTPTSQILANRIPISQILTNRTQNQIIRIRNQINRIPIRPLTREEKKHETKTDNSSVAVYDANIAGRRNSCRNYERGSAKCGKRLKNRTGRKRRNDPKSAGNTACWLSPE